MCLCECVCVYRGAKFGMHISTYKNTNTFSDMVLVSVKNGTFFTPVLKIGRLDPCVD